MWPSSIAMVIFVDLAEAVALAHGPGGEHDLDFVVCCDSRGYDSLAWGTPLRELRHAWARCSKARVLVDLVGRIPAEIAHMSHWWFKVRLAQIFCNCRRVRFVSLVVGHRRMHLPHRADRRRTPQTSN